ncbi:helix-turn-helix domain-containing protein [Altererythrobacter sp. GH1-8]|uniref:helix-turn-helix domain-containing protein n=1 Tax=Altererythrobacter sp. GH1-8 TaxID=3349333 RepID=UPI00374D4D69
MDDHTAFDTFTRSAFGVEPGGRTGSQLEAMAHCVSLPRGIRAPLDHMRDQVVYIVRGATKLAARASGNREQIVAFHFGGDIVSVPADGLHAYAMTSLVQTELLVFPAQEFFDRAATEDAIARSLLRRLTSALHRCRDKAVALGCKSANERLAGFLMAMSERVGKVDGNRCTLELPMSRRDIGDSLGLTIETVSRQLGVMREAGLIETSGRSQIVVRDLNNLARRAGHQCQHCEIFPQNSKFDLDQCAECDPRIAVDATEGA